MTGALMKRLSNFVENMYLTARVPLGQTEFFKLKRMR